MPHADAAKASGRSDRPTAWPPIPLSPMLAVAAPTLPHDDPNWAYEFKWDGIRLLAAWDGRTIRLRSRNGHDVTDQYPELSASQGLGHALGPGRRVVLDGELIAPDDQGRPSFQRLQRRLNVRPSSPPARRRTSLADAAAPRPPGRPSRKIPVVYLLFDLLCQGEESLLDTPYLKRRERLDALKLDADHWRIPPSQQGSGNAMLRAAARVGLEGVIAKRVRSLYRPGVRTDNWLKIKIRQEQEFVVVGWTEMRGSPGRLGSLILAWRQPGPTPRWRLAGQAGSGLSEGDRQFLKATLQRFERPDSVLADPLPIRREQVHHVEPLLVVQVSFHEWTDSGVLRHPVYRGIRADKDPRDVVRETAAGQGPTDHPEPG